MEEGNFSIVLVKNHDVEVERGLNVVRGHATLAPSPIKLIDLFETLTLLMASLMIMVRQMPSPSCFLQPSLQCFSPFSSL
jgi:hypothetical protein